MLKRKIQTLTGCICIIGCGVGGLIPGLGLAIGDGLAIGLPLTMFDDVRTFFVAFGLHILLDALMDDACPA